MAIGNTIQPIPLAERIAGLAITAPAHYWLSKRLTSPLPIVASGAQ